MGRVFPYLSFCVWGGVWLWAILYPVLYMFFFLVSKICSNFCFHFTQKEIEILRARLVVLEAKDQQLRREIEEQDQFLHVQDCELSTLLSWISRGELQAIGKALTETSNASRQIPCSLDFPESIKRYYYMTLWNPSFTTLIYNVANDILLYGNFLKKCMQSEKK